MRLSSMILGALCLTGSVALATPSLAQSRPVPNSYIPVPTRGSDVGRPTSDQYRLSMEYNGQRLGEAEEMTVEEAEAQYGAERVALAQRVQALMDAGQCTEARQMASEAGERAMALRVRQTCRRR